MLLAEHVSEHTSKGVHLVALRFVDSVFTTSVVLATLIFVAEDLVGRGNIVKFLFGYLIASVPIGMVLQGEFTIGLLDICILRIFLQIQDFIEVPALVLCVDRVEE